MACVAWWTWRWPSRAASATCTAGWMAACCQPHGAWRGAGGLWIRGGFPHQWWISVRNNSIFGGSRPLPSAKLWNGSPSRMGWLRTWACRGLLKILHTHRYIYIHTSWDFNLRYNPSISVYIYIYISLFICTIIWYEKVHTYVNVYANIYIYIYIIICQPLHLYGCRREIWIFNPI